MDFRICQAKKIMRLWAPEKNKNLRDVVTDAMCEMEYAAARANGEVAIVLDVIRAYPHLEKIIVREFINEQV